ncbi:hypothetical protein FOCC_FOCC016845 [Frankliniella occidentalis]|nr:hypothetical protein FOCC_FOCC016845 [Frankliniella occidentalis]
MILNAPRFVSLLSRTMRQKSEVWKSFVKIDKDNARCKLCQKVVVTSGNTRNLWKHLKRFHKDLNSPTSTETQEDEEFLVDNAGLSVEDTAGPSPAKRRRTSSQPTTPSTPRSSTSSASPSTPRRPSSACSFLQPTLSQSFSSAKSFEENGSKTVALREALIFMIAKDNLPLSTTEKVGFKHFCKVAVPLWKPPSRSTVTSMIESKYAKLSEVVKNAILKMDQYCMTADIWTDMHTVKSYLGATVHFVEDKEKMRTILLGLRPLVGTHSGENVSAELDELCFDWGIDRTKVIGFITDNADNMKKGTAKKIVTFTRRSVKTSDELRRIQQEEMDISQGATLKLLQDVSTRWNSTYFMLKRFLSMSDIVSAALLRNPKAPEMLTGREMQICAVLMQSTCTASKVIPLVNLAKALSEVNVHGEPIARDTRDGLLSAFGGYFMDLEKKRKYAVATFLDPRFKTLHFSDATVTAETTAFVARELKAVMQQTRDASSFDEEEEDSDMTMPLELRTYIGRPVLPLKGDPFQQWQTLKAEFPELYKVAQKYLPMLSTSVPSESFFSRAGNIGTDERSRLTPEHLSQLCFLSSLDLEYWHSV